MAKRCSICTDAFEAAKRDKCPKCQILTDLGIDKIRILLKLAETIPRRAKRYLDRVNYFTPYSVEPIPLLPDGIKDHQARRAIGSNERTSVYWCSKCNVPLSRPFCLVCKLRGKKDDY
jgi:hypothetical protein